MAKISELKVLIVLLAILGSTTTALAAKSLSEDQARAAAAGFVKGFGFGPNGGQIIPVPDGPAAKKTIEEVAAHLKLAFLVTRGETGYCGPIREPTWLFLWDTEEAASWHGGYPVMVNARTGKVLDCRS
jgi:hypothetical protein